MRLLNPQEPLWMPAGSVRAILALTIVMAAIATGRVAEGIVMAVLIYYFEKRSSKPNQTE